MDSIATRAEGHAAGAAPRRKPRRHGAEAIARAPGEAHDFARPTFPPWARRFASQNAEGRTCRGTGEGRPIVGQLAEGKEAKGSGARSALEWPNEGRLAASQPSEGRRFAGQNAEGLSDRRRGNAERLDWDAEEGRGGPGESAAAAFLAGAALAALDPLLRQEEASFRGGVGARLALQAAAASARILGRAEDEAALRDAFYLRPPGAEAGPAGSLLAAFRTLAARRPEWIFREEAAEKIVGALGLPAPGPEPEGPERPDTGWTEILHAAAALARGDRPAIFAATDAAALACEGLAPNAGRARAIFALLLADAVLACRLGWPKFVPLLCTSKGAGEMCLRAPRTPSSPAGRERVAGAPTARSGAAFAARLCLGAAEAAARAHDLFRDLARRAERLEAALPKLRAKGAAGALEKILSEDAVTAAMRPGGLSDRASRRLFDRLVALGVLRELSGRLAFRLYGL